MTAEHDRIESRLRLHLAEPMARADAERLDARVRAAIAAPPRALGHRPMRSPLGGFSRRVSAIAAGVVVTATAVALAFSAWAVGPFQAPVTSMVGAVGSPAPSSDATVQSASASPTPERIVITPPPDPIPMMDADQVLRMLEPGVHRVGDSTVTMQWWAPGRALGRFGRTDERSDGRLVMGIASPPGAEVEFEPRPDGIVRIRSRAVEPGDPDPLGCAVGSFGRYRIAATERRLDLVPIVDACEARAAAVAGTWRATGRWDDDASLVLTPAVPGGAFTVSRALAGAFVNGEGRDARARRLGLVIDDRDASEGPTPRRAFEVHRPDATVRIGFPTASLTGPCDLPADPRTDEPIASLDAAIEHLRSRPGIEVQAIQPIRYPGIRLERVDLIRRGDPSPCPVYSLFDIVDTDQQPLWPVPAPPPDRASSSVYLAEIPVRDGQVLVVAALVLPPQRPADTATRMDEDTIVKQVLWAFDWQPELHPPDWDAPPG